MKNVLKPLAKSVWTSLGLTAVGTTTDASINNKIFVLGMTTLIISNEEMKDVMKIVKSLENSSLLNNSKWSKRTKKEHFSVCF